MDVKELQLLSKLSEMKEWVSRDWDDEDWKDIGKQTEAKIFCMDYIEPFIEVEIFIRDRDNSEKLTNYFYNLPMANVKNIKRMYEETNRFIGFNSLNFNFFIDDIIDELNLRDLTGIHKL